MESVVIIIPSRYGSTRLKGKPLAMVAGKTLIQRVWTIADAVAGVAGVHVATDDERIADHVRGFGGQAIMTPATCENGTERVLAAARTLDPAPSIVVNFQGDAALTPPWVLQGLVDGMRRDPGVKMATAAVKLCWSRYQELLRSKAGGEVGGTTVTFDRAGNALYFSKSVIPFVRSDAPQAGTDAVPVYRHIGIYAYRFDTLRRYLTLEPGPLERAEKLEQLRALEHGIPVRVVEVDYQGRTHWAIDSPQDVVRVEDLIRSQGELVTA